MNVSMFNFNGMDVRMEARADGTTWVHSDVCRAIHISKERDVYAKLDDDERVSMIVDTLGGPQKVNAITEAGLYSLILQSRKPEAKAFKRWITHEVLPTLRRTGRYEAKAGPVPSRMAVMREMVDVLDEHEARLARLEAATAPPPPPKAAPRLRGPCVPRRFPQRQEWLAFSLLRLVDACLFAPASAPWQPWEGLAAELDSQLTAPDSPCRHPARRFCYFSGATGTALGAAEKCAPGRVSRRMLNGHTRWLIQPPEAPAPAPETSPSNP